MKTTTSVTISILIRQLAIGSGIVWSLLFIGVGMGAELQLYADGSIFSYAVAVEDAWAFHWRNISGRVFVYLFFFLPAERVVALGGAEAGIAAYGLLHFAAPALGLAATYAADRSRGRVYFVFACVSTASLCPLVFGFPTEMWAAHALFWPTLALSRHASRSLGGGVALFAAFLSLVLTHEGAVPLALGILVVLAPAGWRDGRLRRASLSFLAAMAVWAAVKLLIQPDAYFAGIVEAAAFDFIAPGNLTSPVFRLLAAALVAYTALFAILRRAGMAGAASGAALLTALALAVYWIGFDDSLHAGARYPARTAILVGSPVLAVLAVLGAGEPDRGIPALAWLNGLMARVAVRRWAAGALLVVMLAHGWETAKFTIAWVDYKNALRDLAMGETGDPELGDPRFVSAGRMGGSRNRLSWLSTMPYLAVLVSPGFAPRRLVVDPAPDNYYWIDCETARMSATAERGIPAASRGLIAAYACLHR